MAAQQNFRSAFNGFNREDVVHYIEYLNSKHTAELNQLKSEVEYLQTRVSQEAAPVIEQQANRIRELFDQNKALEEELAALRAEKTQPEVQPDDSLADQLNAVTAERDELAEKLDDALKQLDFVTGERNDLAVELDGALQKQTVCNSRMEEELAAYRRAERAERLARERANQMYTQANGVIADATVKVDEAAAQISEMSETVMAQLQLLQLAVAGSTNALKDAAATMYTIRPETEE